MFCPKCGARVADTGRFCAKCGNQIAGKSGGSDRPSPSISGASVSLDGSRTKELVFAGVQVIFVILSFFPLVNLNMPYVGGGYSLFNIMGLYGSYGEQLSRFTAYMPAEFYAVVFFVIALLIIWVAAVCFGVYGVVKVLQGKSVGGVSSRLFVVLSVLCLLAILFTNAQFGSMVSGFGSLDYELVSATPVLWVLGIGSFAAYMAYYLK